MKADLNFGLENATWPAFAVDAQGVIRRASQGCTALFGSLLESAYLSSIWGPGNELSAEQFLARLERGIPSQNQLRLRIRGGGVATLNVLICHTVRDGQKYFIFQLPPEVAAGRPERESQSAADLALAHKQKLDCALQLTRTVALDFNNALTSILVHISHILDQMDPAHPWRGSLVEAEKAAEKASEIANDLAAFSRQEKDSRSQTVGNLNMLLRRAMELFQKPGTAPNIQWKAEFESHPFTATYDEAKMQQALVKILENAVQALTPDGGSITVSTRNLELREATHDQGVQLSPGAYLVIEVKDDGPGIPAEVLPRVFEPFFTTKKGHRGLGLAWVYGIITNHGGSVAISSTPGAGTSVRVYLPASKRVIRDTLIDKAALRGNETILMVDDEDLVLTMAQMVLSSFGYRVLTANCGEKALEIVQNASEKIDLVITDLVMPRMGGRELIEHLRRISPDLRIIYSSGFVRPATEDEEFYLQKPFTSKELLAKVRHVLSL
ncbi:MAG: ATP-binding protein [Verrucomicrobiae bacterium]|nr:ATP-binding protein [Verrucomicrobiae bacterium]